MSSKVYSNRYATQEDLTIGSFSIPLEAISCGVLFQCSCDIDFAMHTFDQGVWEEVWTGTKTGFFNGYVPSGRIGVPLRAGEQFALTAEYNCNYELTYEYDSSGTSPSSSLLDFEVSYTGSGGGDVSPEGIWMNTQTYYDQVVTLETVP